MAFRWRADGGQTAFRWRPMVVKWHFAGGLMVSNGVSLAANGGQMTFCWRAYGGQMAFRWRAYGGPILYAGLVGSVDLLTANCIFHGFLYWFGY